MGLPHKKEDRHYTYGDYLFFPDDERWELIEGVAYSMSPAPSYAHQEIVTRLIRIFDRFLKGKPCRVYPSPIDVLLPGMPVGDEEDVDTVVQPDLIVVCDRRKINGRFCAGAPDLVVEILSPGTASKDFRIKSFLYERHGIREYWIVDPGNSAVHLSVPNDGRYDDPLPFVHDSGKNVDVPSTVFPGLTVGLGELFDDLWSS